MSELNSAGPQANRAAGFTLLQAMASIAVLSAFAMVAVQVATISLRVPARVAERENGLIAEAGTIERLREDVWSAVKIDAEPDGKSVNLLGPSGTTVHWSISERGGLTSGTPAADEGDPADATMRIDQQKQSSMMTWKSFAADASGLKLSGERTSGDFREHVIVLPSPLRISEKRGKS